MTVVSGGSPQQPPHHLLEETTTLDAPPDPPSHLSELSRHHRSQFGSVAFSSTLPAYPCVWVNVRWSMEEEEGVVERGSSVFTTVPASVFWSSSWSMPADEAGPFWVVVSHSSQGAKTTRSSLEPAL